MGIVPHDHTTGESQTNHELKSSCHNQITACAVEEEYFCIAQTFSHPSETEIDAHVAKGPLNSMGTAGTQARQHCDRPGSTVALNVRTASRHERNHSHVGLTFDHERERTFDAHGVEETSQHKGFCVVNGGGRSG